MLYIFDLNCHLRENTVTWRMPVALEDVCRRLIAFVNVYTGASFFYVSLLHYECLEV
jgi:hypothetical protein